MPDVGDEREVPEGQSRKQILTYERVRDYINDRKTEAGLTYSEQIERWLPDDAPVHEFEDDDIVNIKATPEVHRLVTSLAGPRVSPGDVLAYYTMLEAIEAGDFEAADHIAETIPAMLWEQMEDADYA